MRCLGCIFNCTGQCKMTGLPLIVVDDGGSEIVEKGAPVVVHIEHPGSLGKLPERWWRRH